MRRALLTTIALGALALPAPAHAIDPARELRNYSKQNERAQYDFHRPERLTDTHVDRARGFVDAAGVVLRDPSRNPLTVCAPRYAFCAGDTRTYDWGRRRGLSIPVTWVNRNGATISGHLWTSFTPRGRAIRPRPVVVITPGGAQAPETIYWTQAQRLAERGYVVLTWEPQGQGRSDTLGAGDHVLRGVPSEQYPNFRDGTVDAIDFVSSTARAPYRPRGAAARAKQRDRVRRHLSPPANPLAAVSDPRRLGLAGHSFGAVAASEVAGSDRRVDAVVAWDFLARDICDVYEAGFAQDFCFGGQRRPIPLRVPGLNIAADYGFDNSPNVTDPDPGARGLAFDTYRARGIDTMSVVVRGGSHYECPYIPNALLGATLRGIELCAWYTTAWFDKYLRGDGSADARLLSGRWRRDAASGAIDLDGDANLFSFYHRSRAWLRLARGGRVACDDLRSGCP